MSSALKVILDEAIANQRICSACKRSKPDSEWGLYGRCRDCVNAAKRAAYHRDVDRKPYMAAVKMITYRARRNIKKPLEKHHIQAIINRIKSLPEEDRNAVVSALTEVV